MFKSKNIYLVIFFSVLIASFYIGYGLDEGYEKSPVQKVIRYQLEVSNPSHKAVISPSLSVFAPVKRIANQHTKHIKASHNFELESDKYGNQVLNFNFKDMAPYENRIITITAVIEFSKPVVEPVLEFKAEFLKPQKYIEINNLKVRTQASVLAKLSSSESLPSMATHNWVADKIAYSGYQKQDLGAAHAIRIMKGDCTEYMYLNAALMRAQGIANIAVAGFVLNGNTSVLKPSSYHNWNYAIEDERLILSDTQANNYDRNANNYVVFRVIAKDEIKTLSNTHRFAISSKKLKVKLI